MRFRKNNRYAPDYFFALTVGWVLGLAIACLDSAKEHERSSGVLALFGGLATVYYLNRQIVQAADIAEEERIRRNFAARARLPAALNDVILYGTNCLEPLKSIYPTGPDSRKPSTHSSTS
jgi:hypothetical protein